MSGDILLSTADWFTVPMIDLLFIIAAIWVVSETAAFLFHFIDTVFALETWLT